jgi:hypothetical protein
MNQLERPPNYKALIASYKERASELLCTKTTDGVGFMYDMFEQQIILETEFPQYYAWRQRRGRLEPDVLRRRLILEMRQLATRLNKTTFPHKMYGFARPKAKIRKKRETLVENILAWFNDITNIERLTYRQKERIMVSLGAKSWDFGAGTVSWND